MEERIARTSNAYSCALRAILKTSVMLVGLRGFALPEDAFVAFALVRPAQRGGDRPVWLERSVASPLLGYAHRPIPRMPP